MNRSRIALYCAVALATALLGVQIIQAACTIVWQQAATGLPAAGLVNDVAFGDVDNDGHPELVAGLGAGGIGIYRYSGGVWSGTGLTTGISVSSTYHHLALADINLDGELDIFASRSLAGGVVDPNGGGLVVWKGDGLGTWQPITNGLPSTGWYGGEAIADMDDDGWPDLVVAAKGGGEGPTGVRVFSNNSGSSFSLIATLASGQAFNDVAVTGRNIAATSDGHGIYYWLALPAGGWQFAPEGLPDGGSWRGLAIGDVDNDSYPEMMASGAVPGEPVLTARFDWMAATNSWKLQRYYGDDGVLNNRLDLFDINSDGWLDMVGAGWPDDGGQGLEVWRSGPLGFEAAPSPAMTTTLLAVAVADFDLDGKPDIAAGDRFSGTMAWRGAGVQQSLSDWLVLPAPLGQPLVAAHGDINRDGFLDLIVPGRFGGLEGWLGDGGNTWTECTGLGVSSGVYGDLLVGVYPQLSEGPVLLGARTDSGGITLLTPGISGGLCPPASGATWITTTGSYRGLSAGDVYRNGSLTVAAAHAKTGGGIHLWRVDGGALPDDRGVIADGSTVADTAMGDVEHDGRLEILAADAANGGVAVYDRTVVSAGPPPVMAWVKHVVTATGSYSSIAIGDVNNDGDLDIVAAGGQDGKGLRVWTGRGELDSWRHTAVQTGMTALTYNRVDLIDADHDGDLDILAASNAGLRIWAGDGAGGWTADNANLPSSGDFTSALWGHVDHDGNPDIVATLAGNFGGLRLWAAADGSGPTVTPIGAGLWISATQSPVLKAYVQDTGTGISTTSGMYQYSTDGGTHWSGWLPGSITGSDGSTAQQRIEMPAGVPFNQDSQTRNVIRFRASDMAGNVGVGQMAVQIDTVAPVATGLSAVGRAEGSWSVDRYISADFDISDATSGVQGASFVITTEQGLVPPEVLNATAFGKDSGPLADGKWHLYMRPVDKAGNWSTAYLHYGFVGIDTAPPQNPSTPFSTNLHEPGEWSTNPVIDMMWSPGVDSGSGVDGYSRVWDHSPNTVPDASADLQDNHYSTALPDGVDYWFHVRVRDAVGNWAAGAAHAGPYKIDSVKPVSTPGGPSGSTTTAFTIHWSGTDNLSGIVLYLVQSRDATLNGQWTTWRESATAGEGTFYGKPGHIYEFRSRALDAAGNAEDWPDAPDWVVHMNNLDLSVVTPYPLEVIQSVQNLAHGVPLFAYKRTFVWCYVKTNNYVNSVPARLEFFSNGVSAGYFYPINPGGTVIAYNVPVRDNIDTDFLFEVPAAYVHPGSARFVCTINPDRSFDETDYLNNTAEISLLVFPGIQMKIETVNVKYVDANGGFRTVRNLDQVRVNEFLTALYPISYVDQTRGSHEYDSEPDLSDVNSMLDDMVDSEDEAADRHHFGMLYIPESAHGLGNRPGLTASGTTGPSPGVFPGNDDGSFGDDIAVHELGHNLDQLHLLCGGNEESTEDPPEGYTPYSFSPSTSPWQADTAYGLDSSVWPPRVHPPNQAELMGYCKPRWIAPYRYNWLYYNIVNEASRFAAQQATALPADRLAVYGSIVTPTQAITLSAFYHVESATDRPGRDISGTYSIRFFDAGGALLQDYAFSPTWQDEFNGLGAFGERPPWISSTNQIAIWHGETALVTRTVSAAAPVVTMTVPNGGETLNGRTATVMWSGSDADPGDVLAYRLDYSRDGGATWAGIKSGLRPPTTTVDLGSLPGTTQGKFRVRASDGVNMGSDETDGVFTVPAKIPEITFIEPVSGTTYVLSQTITFRGGAYDADDNTLGDSRLAWTSSLMGPLGTGSLVQRTDLITGTHVITLTATDSDANSVRATTMITVGEWVMDRSYPVRAYLPIVLKQ